MNIYFNRKIKFYYVPIIKKILFFSLSFFFLQSCLTQNFTIPLWDKQIPNYRLSDEVEQSSVFNGRLTYSRVPKPDISVYLTSGGNDNGQAVIICPGGGYVAEAYDWEGTEIAKWLNSKGIAAIVLKYRLPGSKSNIVKHLSPLMDAQRAIRLVRANAKKWNINPNQIGIMGFSAGGHLASSAGTHFDNGLSNPSDSIEKVSCRPDFMALIYPVITFTDSSLHRGSRTNLLGEKPDTSLYRFFSSELQVSANTPPTFIFHTEDDQVVPVKNALLMYNALVKKNISAELHIFPHGNHGCSLALGNKELEQWTDLCIHWIHSLNNKK